MSNVRRFIATGVVGFCVDAGLLSLFLGMTDLGPVAGRGASFSAAIATTWFMNKFWSFEDGDNPTATTQVFSYIATQILGFAINFGVYIALIWTRAPMFSNPIFALAIGGGLSALVTYCILRTVVFPRSALHD